MIDVSVTLTFRFTSDLTVNHVPEATLRNMLGLLSKGRWGILDPNIQVRSRRISDDDMDMTRALLTGKHLSELLQAYEDADKPTEPILLDVPGPINPAEKPTPTIAEAATKAVGKMRDAIDAEKKAAEDEPDATEPARRFLAERCVLDGVSQVGWRPLHQLYKTWCEGQGSPILPVNDWRTLLMGLDGVTVDPEGRTVEGIAMDELE